MRVCTLASSSSGNCTFVSCGETSILIDAGISLRRIRVALKALDASPEGLSGVIVTHGHTDHINGLKMLSRYCRIPIYAPRGVGMELYSAVPEAEGLINVFPVGSGFDIGSLTIKSTPTMHDAPESVGYRIEGGGASLAFVTDLGCVTKNIVQCMSGAGMAIIEANHDPDLLMSGPYPYGLKKRILSNSGHLSNEASGSLAAMLADSGASTIVLAHLSCENNTPELARKTVSAALGDRLRNIRLDVAPPATAGEVYII